MAQTPVIEHKAEADPVRETARRLVENIESVVVGKHDEVVLVLAALISGGHVLLEDVPGTAKTMLARSLAQTIEGGEFARAPVHAGPAAHGRDRALDLQPADARVRVPARARCSRTSCSSTRSTARCRGRSRRCSRRWPSAR